MCSGVKIAFEVEVNGSIRPSKRVMIVHSSGSDVSVISNGARKDVWLFFKMKLLPSKHWKLSKEYFSILNLSENVVIKVILLSLKNHYTEMLF